MGMNAQDVEKVFPEAVSKRGDGYIYLDAKPINYAPINAIQELKAPKEALKASNEELQELNATILKRLDALEAHAMH